MNFRIRYIQAELDSYESSQGAFKVSLIVRLRTLIDGIGNLLINSKELPEGFQTLDLDQSLEKIINETTFEKMPERDTVKLLKNKLHDSNFSDKHPNLRLKAEEILSYLKKKKGFLSYIKGSNIVLVFIIEMKDFLGLQSNTSSDI